MSKTVKAVLVALLSLAVAFFIAVMVLFINNDYTHKEMSLINSYETEVGAAEKIVLDLNSTDVEIKTSSNEKISVEFYSNTDADITIENRDNTLAAEENELTYTTFFNLRKKLIVYVPSSYTGGYEISAESGDIKAENDMTENAVNISVLSGDVFLNAAGNITLSAESGDVKIDEINKKADISTSSGDIFVDSLELKEASDITASSGDIAIGTLDIKESSNITTSSGDVTVKANEGNCYIETDTDSGDVRVGKSDRKSDIVLKIRTSSGDIFVN